jgi:hypothetical protein
MRGSSALDPLMAGFAAGAAAFIVFAMPQASFDRLVSLSGLPMILSAAQPPLGMTARGGVMIAAGIAAFLIVWFVLRALGKPAPKSKKRSGPVEIEMEPPRLRRADMHPDAPSRRPILAGVDLGKPFDEIPLDQDRPLGDPQEEHEEIFSDSSERSEYDFEPREPDYATPAYVEETADAAADDLPAFHDVPEEAEILEEREASVAEPDFDAEEDLSEETEETGEPAAVFVPLPDPVEEEEPGAEEEPQALPLPPRRVESVAALSNRLPESGAAASIDELMERLEAGLARRQPARWMVPGAEVQNGNGHAPASGANELDARLRGAIDELQKLASRGS